MRPVLPVGLGARLSDHQVSVFSPEQFWVIYPKFEVLGTLGSFFSNYFPQSISEFLTEGVNS